MKMSERARNCVAAILFVPGLAFVRHKIETCDQIVKNIKVQSAANEDNIQIALATLKRAQKRIQFAIGNVDANGKIIDSVSPSFSDVYYSGYARKMSPKLADVVIGRLNGLAENLQSKNNEMNQVDPVEARGIGAIDEALDSIENAGQIPRRLVLSLRKFLRKTVATKDTSRIFIAGLKTKLKLQNDAANTKQKVYIDVVTFFDKTAAADKSVEPSGKLLAGYEPVLLIVYRALQ